MGVRGLKTFVDNNSDLLRPHHLFNTPLVIDGCNLQFCLYFRSCHESKDYIYGGDYPRYAATIRQFFKTLLKCNIKPIVIFDGGIDISMAKFKTVMDRFRQRLDNIRIISKHNLTGERVLPRLAYHVFLSVMNEMNIDHVQAEFEADTPIAMIANHLQCPVMSNDSDFFVYDLNGGFIPYDSLDKHWLLRVHNDDEGNQYKYIECRYYHVNNLLEYFPGVTPDKLPLFSTLMGNDYVHPKVFDKIFNAIPSTGISKKKAKALHVSKKHERMIRLLNWLKNTTIDDAIKYLIKFLKTNSRDKALNLLSYSLENYQNGKGKCDLINYIPFINQRDDKNRENSDDNRNEDNENENIDSVPNWFINEFHQSIILPFIMNIQRLKINLLMPQIDDFSLPSSFECTLKLRQFLYGLLRRESDDSKAIIVYDRKDSSISKFEIEPCIFIDDHHMLPSLNELRDLDINQRKLLLFTILKTDESFVDDVKNKLYLYVKDPISIDPLLFLIIVIRYWISEAKVIIWDEFIYSLIIGIIFCGYIDTSSNIKFVTLNKNECVNSVKEMTKFCARPQHNCAKIFQPRVVHFYLQFQASLFTAILINSLLEFPFNNGLPYYCFNGNFLYNLTIELSNRKEPDLYLCQLLGRQSLASNAFRKIYDAITEGFDSSAFARSREVTNRKTHIESQKLKIKKKSKSKNITNRFASLKIEKE